jgi:hypothetical protein
MKNYYQILGWDNSATIEEIKAAYKYLAKKFHPDKNPGDAISKKYFQDIQEAYECLSDVTRRRVYDATYKAWSEGKAGNSNQQQPENRSKEIAEFQASLKKMQKNYITMTSILSSVAAFGLGYMFYVNKDTSSFAIVFIPFVASAVLYIALYLYFLPTIIAYNNCHEYKREIFTLNCFSIFANLLTPLTFIIFYVCLLVYAQGKVKGINKIFMVIIGLFLAGMSAKHEREKRY